MSQAAHNTSDKPLQVEYVQSPRFDFSNPLQAKEGLAYLETNGYVIVADVMTPEEIEKAKELFWEFIEGFSKRMETIFPGFSAECEAINRNDPTTWDNHWPGDSKNGIIGRYGAGQSPFAWFVRSRPKVINVFQQVWQTDDLLTSFDAFNAFRPWQLDPSWKTSGGWYHVDQNPKTKPGRVCVQGLVSLYDTTEDVGGLTVIPGSNQLFKHLPKTQNIGGTHDFVPIMENHDLLKTTGRVLLCKAGDLCLWDSRTVHCNSPAKEKAGGCGDKGPQSDAKEDAQFQETLQGLDWQDKHKAIKARQKKQKLEYYREKLKQQPKWSLLRLVCYVCMTPARFASSEVLALRKRAVKDTQTTSHWPHEFIQNGPGSPAFDTNPYILPHLVLGKKKGCVLM